MECIGVGVGRTDKCKQDGKPETRMRSVRARSHHIQLIEAHLCLQMKTYKWVPITEAVRHDVGGRPTNRPEKKKRNVAYRGTGQSSRRTGNPPLNSLGQEADRHPQHGHSPWSAYIPVAR